MTEPINLNEVRANKADNATLWTPLDCLRALLRDLDNGTCLDIDGIYIAMCRKDNNDGTAYPFYTAGLTALEVRGLLAEHLHGVCAASESGK